MQCAIHIEESLLVFFSMIQFFLIFQFFTQSSRSRFKRPPFVYPLKPSVIETNKLLRQDLFVPHYPKLQKQITFMQSERLFIFFLSLTTVKVSMVNSQLFLRCGRWTMNERFNMIGLNPNLGDWGIFILPLNGFPLITQLLT